MKYKATRASSLECVAFVLSFHLSMQPSPHCNLVVLARLQFGVKHVFTTVKKTHSERIVYVTVRVKRHSKNKKQLLIISKDNHVRMQICATQIQEVGLHVFHGRCHLMWKGVFFIFLFKC